MMRHLARLLWTLPEAFHERLGDLTGGWRVVYFRDDQLSAADRWTWERWPDNVRPEKYK